MTNCNPFYPGAAGLAGIAAPGGRRAAVLAPRVLDSCSAKECVDHLQLLFTEADQAVIAISSHAKDLSAKVDDVTFEEGEYIKGKCCYSVDATYYFSVELLAYPAAGGEPVALTGYCCYQKRVLLYGEENGVRTFTSGGTRTLAIPEVSAQVAEPVLLDVCLTNESAAEPCRPHCGRAICVPGAGLVYPAVGANTVFCTLGLFSVFSLLHSVEMVMPVYDYALPLREDNAESEDPCEFFESMNFPVRQFYPGRRIY